VPLIDVWETLAVAGLTGRLADGQERLKAAARVDAKVREDARVKGSDPELALAAMTDAVRYTLVYPDADYDAGLRADTERLAARGFELIDRKAGPEAGARAGVTTVWRAPAAEARFEVQFHTPVSHSARERSFPLYARLREPQAGDLERAELAARHRAIYAAVRGGGPLPVRLARARAERERVTYYAIRDGGATAERPAGLARRIEHRLGQRDEAFGYDLSWRHTFLLYAAERGSLDNRLVQISGNEAQRLVFRIRTDAQVSSASG
jgi:hypothetical protein